MHIHTLLIEDNLDLAATLVEYLDISGIICDHAADGQSGLNLARHSPYDVILLDIMLPRLDGQKVCRTLREAGVQTPILMITSLDSLQDKLDGFACGTDDYLVKPFELPELVARLRALSQRLSSQASLLQVADLQMNLATREARRNNQRLHLSPTAWQLLECLLRASPNPVSRERLERAIWGDEPPDSNSLKVHLCRLRRSVDKGFTVPLIHTQAGVGFCLRTP
ncbi:response regulator transcription factor [Pseudomonas sp. B6002]|uniref:response regulator transcription factor n=1 Tax=Pseudomonas sp. B6002 TaxID=2726978 RepID=UPI0015A1B850|nr:response regulator transcription factor [Pseudomonas sp. B6002]NVZ49684.1 response regulator transcription factor [Pseudomonas sp. B6002]